MNIRNCYYNECKNYVFIRIDDIKNIRYCCICNNIVLFHSGYTYFIEQYVDKKYINTEFINNTYDECKYFKQDIIC